MKRHTQYREERTVARNAITLLEVVIALVILGAGVLSLRTASSIGRRATAIATQQREGIRRARMLLEEIEAGLRDWKSHAANFQDDPNWIFQVETQEEQKGLRRVQVSVHHKHQPGSLVALDRLFVIRGDAL